MSNNRINIRLFYWHLQVSWDWKFSFGYNPFHKGKLKQNGIFAVYEFDLKT